MDTKVTPDTSRLLHRSRGGLLPAAVLSALLVLGWSVVVQRSISSASGLRLGAALTTVLETSHQALKSWSDGQRATAQVWGSHAAVVELTRELLSEQPGGSEALITSSAQRQLRSLLGPVLRSNRYEGFFLVGPDDISLASTRDANIGTVNLLANGRSDTLERIRQGEAVLSLPLLWVRSGRSIAVRQPVRRSAG